MLELAQVAADAYSRSGGLSAAAEILAGSGRAMIIVDGATGTIVHANDAAEELFAQPLVGVGLNRLIPERYQHAHDELRGEFMRGEGARPMTAGVDVLAVTGDGSESLVRIGLTPIPTTRLVIAEIDPIADAT